MEHQLGGKPMSNRVYIFDTTLRDGEQSPGCSMTVPEKLLMARKLVELGVDILEAGFPIASQGDDDAVDAISREYPWVQVAALARCCTLDVERAASALQQMLTVFVGIRSAGAERGGVVERSNGDHGRERATTITALQARARQIDCTMKGIGMQAGNGSRKEVGMAIKTRHDRYTFHTN